MENKLKELRKVHGLTQKQVAEFLGHKSEDRISHWEKGQAIPSVPNLFKLAKLYKALPHEIYPIFWG
jgi:transcriptional regulator with XRE-family HTH domain